MESGTPKKRKTWRRSLLFGCMLSAILLPILTAGIIYGLYRHNQARTARLQTKVQADLDNLTKAVEEYRSAKGQYPQSLDDLLTPTPFVAELPIDPYSPNHEPYRYMNLNNARLVLLYSVGEDAEDNSGFNDINRFIYSDPYFDTTTSLCQNLQIERTRDDLDNAMALYMEADQKIQIDTRVIPWQKIDTINRLGWARTLKLLEYANRSPQSDLQPPFPGADMTVRDEFLENESPTLDDVKSHMDSMQPLMEMIHQIAQKPKIAAVYSDLEYCTGGGVVPNLGRKQFFAKVMVSQARYHEYMGDKKKALSTYCDAIWLGHVRGYNTPLIEDLINDAVKAIPCSALHRSLLENDFDAKDLEELVIRLGKLQSLDAPVSEVFRLHALQISHFRKHWTITKSFAATQEYVAGKSMWGKKPDALEVAELQIRNFIGAPSSLKRIENRYIAMARMNSYGEICAFEQHDRGRGMWTPESVMMNITESPMTRRNCANSLITATRLTAALKLHKLRHGAYPEKLEDLSEILNPIPTDPFTGKMFEYAKTGDAFTLYTPGPELEDNGGLIEYDPTNGVLSAGDITFGPR